MYNQFFGLRANPFSVNPDLRFLFLTRHAQEPRACLTYGIQSRRCFILLSGEVGTGKTTLLNKLLDRYRAGETAVLIIDEVQNLSLQVLEEIRMLTNLETATEKLLQIVLAGQPELEEKVSLPQLRQLRQRITLRCRTQPLTGEETRAYIAQRLKIAGGHGCSIFDKQALEAVHKYARGIPRIINLLCDHALLSAFVDKQRDVGAEVIEAVAREFDLLQPQSAQQVSDPSLVETLHNGALLTDRFRRPALDSATTGKPGSERSSRAVYSNEK